MKKILKYVVVLLLLFALIGTASAAVSNVQASVTNNATTPGNYDVSVTWDGSLIDPVLNEFIIVIDTTAHSATEGDDGRVTDFEYVFENIILTAGTAYTVTVADDDTNSDISAAFTPLPAPPVFAVFSTTTDPDPTVNPTVFDLTWTLTRGALDIGDLEFFDGSAWIDVNTTTATTFTGNPATVNTFRFRYNDAGTFSDETTYTLQPITISSSKTSNSVTWTLASTGWDSYDYLVIETSTGLEATGTNTNGTTSGTTIAVTGLAQNTQYTLNVRGNNTAPDVREGLWRADTVTTDTAVVELVDTFDPSDYYDFSKGTDQGTFAIENSTYLDLTVETASASTFSWTLNKTTPSVTNVTSEATIVSASTKSEFSWKPSEIGPYHLTLVITSGSDTQTITWDLTVNERTTGNRIWQGATGTNYTWDARSFAGFYYDLDDGYGSEYMEITNIDRSLAVGSIFYTTTASGTNYAYSGWGSYQIVGFMGDKYYAGSGSSSLMANGNLSKVLIDENKSATYRVGQSIALEEGYVLEISQINMAGSSVYFLVKKDGRQIGEGIVTMGNSFNYTPTNFGRTNDTALIRVHVSSVFMGTESSLVTIDGIFQISDKLTRLESGTKIDKMEIRTVSGTNIEMRNHERITLNAGTEVTLMGKMKFIVADSTTLRFAPIIEYTEPGTYEIRGTVSDYENKNYIITEWTPMNFEGFYYDIDDDLISEKITIDEALFNIATRRINTGGVEYTSTATTVNYQHSRWGSYTVLGFMGEKYYAGNGGALLGSGNLSKVLIDESERRTMRVGQYITLEEGYALRIDQIDINGGRTYLVLEKDGRNVSGGDRVVPSGGDYIYTRNISNNDVELIKVSIDSVFMGTESSLVTINGLFQASDNLTRLTTDTKYGKMKVASFNSAGIRLLSDETLTLSRGNTVDLMTVGNDSIYFKVGDNDTLRFAPYVKKEIGSNTSLSLEFAPNNPVTGDNVVITVKDRGTAIEGAIVSVNNTSIGTTNTSGQVSYSTNVSGSYRVTAEKSGYVNGSATLTVAQRMYNMTVSVTPDVLNLGATGVIQVTDSLNGTAIPDAAIRLGNTEIGTTNSNGEMTYTFGTLGNFTVQASKSGYNNATKSVSVIQNDAFSYTNFEMKPSPPTAKSNLRLTFDATNIGTADGTHTVKLTLRDSSGAIIAEDSETITLGVGKSKSVTLTVKPPAEGSYTLTLTETDSNRQLDLPSHMSSVSVGASKLFGSTLLYIVLAFIGLILLAIVGFLAYLFGVKGATKENYKVVAGDIFDDAKSKFKK